jgi:hypothetical protein
MSLLVYDAPMDNGTAKEKQMEAQAKRNVLLFCKIRKLDVAMPSRGNRDILVTDWSTGFGKHVAEGTKWTDVARQLVAYRERMIGI